MSDPMDFWRLTLSDMKFDYRSRAENLMAQNENLKVDQWEELFSIFEERRLSNYNFPSANYIEVEKDWVYSDVAGDEFRLHANQFFIEIKLDLSMKVFMPQKGEDYDFRHSTLFPRMELWATRRKGTTPQVPTIDLTFLRRDYDGNEIRNSINIDGCDELEQRIKKIIEIDFALRKKIVLFIEERDGIYNNIMYPRGIFNNIKTIMKGEPEAHNDSFVKNKHRSDCVALDFMELNLIIELFDEIYKQCL